MSTLPTNRNTGNTAAEHVNDHNTLHTAFNGQTIQVAPPTVTPAGGATTTSTSVVLPATGASAAYAPIVKIPADWASVHIDVVWFSSVVAGAARINAQSQKLNVGAAADAIIDSAAIDVTAPSNTAFMMVTRILTSFAVTGDSYYQFAAERNGDHANDTMAGNFQIVGIIISKAG